MSALLEAMLILGLVMLNASFVAAEYALLSVRRTRLEQLVQEGDARARQVQTLLGEIGLLFSGMQLGVTVASLLMGALGETIMARAIETVLERYLDWIVAAAVAHTIAVTLAFLFITTLLMVLGELVPKALAYDRAERVSLLVAPFIILFMKLTRHVVRALDAMAGGVLRLMGHAPEARHGTVHTPEEVKLIVAGIRKRGLLAEEQEEMIQSVFDLKNIRVREVMVPRPKITCLAMTQDLNFLLQHVVEDRYSRVPIYEGSPDHIVGILNTKDLLRVNYDRLRARVPLDAPLDLAALLYQPMIVPETMSLAQMLDESRARHSQMALVVDEFGTFVGLVTMEDVLEQIVGEIQDEYDREEKAIHRVGENVLVVDGSLSLRELADDYDLALPRGGGYETLAGFVLAQLGVIPRGGETFVFEGRRYTVLEMDGRRVARVRVEKLAVATAAAANPQVS
ncbi:MAG: hemolysin family protein [Acidobacteriia bacterium]|nr:hemolysin family protein [Terriglobia bacterium]